MNILMIDTSGPACGVAIMRDGRLIYEAELVNKQTHSQRVMPMADAALAMNDMTAAEIDVFGAVTGPGSFTGVRIGVCAINAMAAAFASPVVAVSSLIALKEGLSPGSGPACALIDARNGNAYAAAFDGNACTLQPSAVTIAELLPTLPPRTVFVGDGAAAYEAQIAALVPDARFAPPERNLLTALPVAQAAWKRFCGGETVFEAIPLYLRPTQAERLYKGKK